MPDRFRLTTSDGVGLDARWDRAADASLAVVLCHPDPRQGGTMNAPLLAGVADRLAARGVSVLRFDFRGVPGGRSERGDEEVLDVDAAYTEAALGGGPVAVAGWSFGGAVALRWLAWSGRAVPYVGIAPATALAPAAATLPPAPRLVILGDREQVLDPAAVRAYAAAAGARLVELAGSDHFFHLRAEKVADVAADFLLEVSRPG